MIFKKGQVLLGKRMGSHGEGEYASPGGKMDFGESFGECAKREVYEETGVKIKNIQFMFLSNLRAYSGKHFVHIQLRAEWVSGKPVVKERGKCEEWNWFDIDHLPAPLFATFSLVERHLRTNQQYFDR